MSTKSRRIVVVGSGGWLATKLTTKLNSLGLDFMTTSSDLSNTKSVFLDLTKPEDFDYDCIKRDDIVLLMAGITKPDYCENYKEKCIQVNDYGSSYFIERCFEKGSKVIYFSSDVVYGESHESVNEASTHNPHGTYAKTKESIENKFNHVEDFLILRLSYVFDYDDSFMMYIRSCVDKQAVVELYEPLDRCPVYAGDLIDLIINLCVGWNIDHVNSINCTTGELLSRTDMFLTLKNNFGFDVVANSVEPDCSFYQSRPKIINITSQYFECILGKKPISYSYFVNKILTNYWSL